MTRNWMTLIFTVLFILTLVFSAGAGAQDVAANPPVAGMPNPWITCTEEEAFERLGAAFAFEAPEGFAFEEAAYLAGEFDGGAPSVRIVFSDGKDMYRVHIVKGLEAMQGVLGLFEAFEANDVEAYYDAQSNAIVYALHEEYAVTIDVSGYAAEAVKALAGTVTMAEETAKP